MMATNQAQRDSTPSSSTSSKANAVPDIQLLNKLPSDVVAHMQKCTEAAARSAALQLKEKSTGRADKKFGEHKTEAESFTEMARGILSKDICHYIQVMFFNQGYWAAYKCLEEVDSKVKVQEQVDTDEKEIAGWREKIEECNELTPELIEILEKMGKYNALHYAAKVFKLTHSRVDTDLAWSEDYAKKICGEAVLEKVDFFTDEKKVLEEKPKVIAEQEVRNDTDVIQTSKFIFSSTTESRKILTTDIKFQFGLGASLDVGFSALASVNVSAQFNVYCNKTKSESSLYSETKTYEYPVTVPPHSIVIGKSIVHEATMEVPYILTFDCGGGVKRYFPGIWKGVAASKMSQTLEQRKIAS